MSSVCTGPLQTPIQYIAGFKIDTKLHEGLWLCSTAGISDLISLCCQLDFLCRNELHQTPSYRIDHGRVSTSFEVKAIVLHDKMKTLVGKFPSPQPSLEDYLEYCGLSKLYPRAAAYITRPTDMSISLKKTSVDDYFVQMGAVSQVVCLCHQLNSDVTSLSSHKYIAHQLALLYQSLVALGNVAVLLNYKTTIEMGFKGIKQTLNTADESSAPQLEEEQIQWLLDLTSGLVSTLTALPQDITKNMSPVIKILQNDY